MIDPGDRSGMIGFLCFTCFCYTFGDRSWRPSDRSVRSGHRSVFCGHRSVFCGHRSGATDPTTLVTDPGDRSDAHPLQPTSNGLPYSRRPPTKQCLKHCCQALPAKRSPESSKLGRFASKRDQCWLRIGESGLRWSRGLLENQGFGWRGLSCLVESAGKKGKKSHRMEETEKYVS